MHVQMPEDFVKKSPKTSPKAFVGQNFYEPFFVAKIGSNLTKKN
jgi:hypothetical protein